MKPVRRSFRKPRKPRKARKRPTHKRRFGNLVPLLSPGPSILDSILQGALLGLLSHLGGADPRTTKPKKPVPVSRQVADGTLVEMKPGKDFTVEPK